MSSLGASAAVKVGQTDEPVRLPENGEKERQAKATGTHNAGRGSTDRDPHGQLRLQRAGVHKGISQRGAVTARPRDSFLPVEIEE
jgi:hypothetical protein